MYVLSSVMELYHGIITVKMLTWLQKTQLALTKIKGTEILLGTYTRNCMAPTNDGPKEAFLFDFVVFTSFLNRSEIQQVMLGKNSIRTALSRAQVIGTYANVSTTNNKFQQVPISQIVLKNTN